MSIQSAREFISESVADKSARILFPSAPKQQRFRWNLKWGLINNRKSTAFQIRPVDIYISKHSILSILYFIELKSYLRGQICYESQTRFIHNRGANSHYTWLGRPAMRTQAHPADLKRELGPPHSMKSTAGKEIDTDQQNRRDTSTRWTPTL